MLYLVYLHRLEDDLKTFITYEREPSFEELECVQECYRSLHGGTWNIFSRPLDIEEDYDLIYNIENNTEVIPFIKS